MPYASKSVFACASWETEFDVGRAALEFNIGKVNSEEERREPAETRVARARKIDEQRHVRRPPGPGCWPPPPCAHERGKVTSEQPGNHVDPGEQALGRAWG